MKRFSHTLLILTLAVLSMTKVGLSRLSAQTIAIRTNAFLWGAEGANLSVDFTASESSTIGVTALFSVADSWIHKANLKGCQLEYRYWFSHQPFHSMFVGPIAGIFHYRIDDDTQSQLCMPAGLNCGYAWTLSNHWNLEACYGVGYLYYRRAALDEMGAQTYSDHHKFTTINLGLNISYVF